MLSPALALRLPACSHHHFVFACCMTSSNAIRQIEDTGSQDIKRNPLGANTLGSWG